MRKGISPVIATVIIVAVAIAISIAVAGWLFGLWGGLASGTAQIQVSTVTINTSQNGDNFAMYLVNSGSGSDKLLKVEVTNGSNTYTVDGIAPTDITGNFKGWLYGEVKDSNSQHVTFTQGQSVTVTLYFEKSGTVTIPVTVKA